MVFSTPPTSKPRRRGFTLLELVIAVVILAVISAIALPVYNSLRTSSQLSAEASQLANINKEALSIATAAGRSVPTTADIAIALNDTPTFGAAAGLAAASAVTVTASTAASTSTTVLSADVSTGSVGLALVSPSGGCAMSLLSGSKVSGWFYASSLGANCNGTLALSGPTLPNPGYSAGAAALLNYYSGVPGQGGQIASDVTNVYNADSLGGLSSFSIASGVNTFLVTPVSEWSGVGYADLQVAGDLRGFPTTNTRRSTKLTPAPAHLFAPSRPPPIPRSVTTGAATSWPPTGRPCGCRLRAVCTSTAPRQAHC